MENRAVVLGPTFGPPMPVACRSCGSPLVYPRPCPACGTESTWVDVERAPEPPMGTACWHIREGDPVGVERWWDGYQWSVQIRGGEKMRWLEHLQNLPESARTPYSTDQIDILTHEVEHIAYAVDPMGPPSSRRRSWLGRVLGQK